MIYFRIERLHNNSWQVVKMRVETLVQAQREIDQMVEGFQYRIIKIEETVV